jgi:hypothetical protein
MPAVIVRQSVVAARLAVIVLVLVLVVVLVLVLVLVLAIVAPVTARAVPLCATAGALKVSATISRK